MRNRTGRAYATVLRPHRHHVYTYTPCVRHISPASAVRDFGIYIDLDSDVTIRSHVAKMISTCYRLLGIASTADYPSVSVEICSSVVGVVSRPLAVGYGNSTLAGVSSYFLSRLQSVMNAAARLIFSSSRFQHITPLLRQLHWLKAPERIAFKQSVLVSCLQCESTPPAVL